uniref:Uncharacterized protein n=1 Tax=Ditylenchus dipsaci TaxID=166011 RepID=A0A915DDZ0_9BILA
MQTTTMKSPRMRSQQRTGIPDCRSTPSSRCRTLLSSPNTKASPPSSTSTGDCPTKGDFKVQLNILYHKTKPHYGVFGPSLESLGQQGNHIELDERSTPTRLGRASILLIDKWGGWKEPMSGEEAKEKKLKVYYIPGLH